MTSMQVGRVSGIQAAARWALPPTEEVKALDCVELSGSPEPPRFASKTWNYIERLDNSDPHFVQRNFSPRQLITNPELVTAFGSDHPHSGSVLLHYAGDPSAGVARQPRPVLLVHGANKDANFWWDPAEDGSDKGLPQRLRDQGYQVFALTFAHNQDDNMLQAEQIATCVKRIEALTGQSQVDLVAHSKGGAAARIFVTDGVKEPWMTRCQGNVHRLALVGAPNGGIDYSFRHSSGNLGLYNDSREKLLNAPMSWDNIKVFGVPQDCEARSFDAKSPDYFPGQRQLLARWDSKYPVGMFEPDWYTTYNGGEGFVSHSKGIDHYIQEGDNLVERLNQNKIDPNVQVGLLAGDSPTIPGILNEIAGPSDGLLFVESALMMPSTDKVVKAVIHQHHKGLISSGEGQEWIAGFLGKSA